jgi:glutathione S-transferase
MTSPSETNCLTLFFSPGACSFASHVALEESGLPYRRVEVNTRRGENRSSAFLEVNSWGKVPALAIPSGGVLTEGVAIMTYVADLAVSRALLPPYGTAERARAMEWLSFISSTLHPAFRTMFRPERVAGSSSELISIVQQHGIVALAAVFEEVEKRIGSSDYLVGNSFSLCDGYLTIFYEWSLRVPLRDALPRLDNCARIATNTLARAAVQSVLRYEGLALR